MMKQNSYSYPDPKELRRQKRATARRYRREERRERELFNIRYKHERAGESFPYLMLGMALFAVIVMFIVR